MFKNHESFTRIYHKTNGRDFNFCDCYGICYLFNKEVLNKEIPLYLEENIEDKEAINATYNSKQSEFVNIPIGKETTGDIVSIKFKNMPIHVGVIVEKGVMLHVMENRQAVIESYNSIRWKNKIDSFWRYESTK